MDKKVSVGMVAVIIVVVAITAGVFGAKFVSNKNEAATATSTVVDQELEKIQAELDSKKTNNANGWIQICC